MLVDQVLMMLSSPRFVQGRLRVGGSDQEGAVARASGVAAVAA